jgi:chromosomal replication initiation ATPase DnaA
VEAEAIDTALDGPLLIENADRTTLDERLFHLLNRAADPARGVLITARVRPNDWATALPDLRSRLNALPVVELGHPDDGVLEGVLRRLFAERVITPSPELIAYLRHRIERSVPAAAAVVERLEAAASAQHRPINRALARSLLADKDELGPDEA